MRKLVKRAMNEWVWLATPAALFLAIFFFVPLLEIGARSFTDPSPGIGNYIEFFQSSAFRQVLGNTFSISLVVVTVCLVLAYPYSYIMSHVSGRLALLLLIAVLLPFWSSILVRSYAWIVILRDTGIVNSFLLDLGIINEPIGLVRNFTGVVIGMVHVLLPFMVLPIYAAMNRIDPDYVRAAENLGSPPWQAFWRIYLPLSLPGVFAGVLLVFVLALGFYITPALLGDPRQAMLGQAIAIQVQDLRNFGMGGAMAVILMVITLAVLIAVSRLVRVGEVLSGGRDL